MTQLELGDTGRQRTALALLLLATVATRLYYFWLTHDQPLWWDEAEYLLQGRHLAIGTPNSGYFGSRPPAMSWLTWATFSSGLGEVSVRALLVVLSVGCVYLMYSVGRALVDPWTGLLAAAMFSFNYLVLFYTSRVLTEIPHLFLGLLAVRLWAMASFWRWLWVPVVGAAALFRVPGLLFGAILVAATLFAHWKHWARSRRVWIGVVLLLVMVAAVVTWGIWNREAWGQTLQGWQFIIFRASWGRRLYFVEFYLVQFQRNAGWIALPFLIAGLVRVAREFWLERVSDAFERRRTAALLLCWIAIPTGLYGLIVGAAVDRYSLTLVPAVFLLIAIALLRVAAWLQRFGSRIAIGALAAVSAAIVIELEVVSDHLITRRLDSFVDARDAGLWIREHSEPGDEVLSRNVPIIAYYSTRAVSHPGREPKFPARLENPAVKFIAVDTYEKRGAWIQAPEFPERFGLTLEAAFPPEEPRVRVYSRR
jgi:4-amino-4-deoxy-L-arabinose transferase-like glycosyltransferase